LERSIDDGNNWLQIYSDANTSYQENTGNGSYLYSVKATNDAGSSDWTTGAWDCVVNLPSDVPNVVGMTQSVAETTITGAGLTVGTKTPQYSNTVAAGLVISQNPVGGTAVNIGSSISLVISLGKPVVPNVVGMTQAAATTAITAVDTLTVGTVTQQYSDTVVAGSVISQNPVGTAVNIGSSVNLVISLGKPGTPILSISAVDNQAAETVSGEPANTGTFRISRVGSTTSPLTVYFSRSGTATFGAAGDYTLSTLLATSVVILSGQPSVDITVTPVDNSLAEPNETVILTLAANATYNLAPTVPQRTATVTIADNEPTISITASDSQAGEPANTGTFTISRTGGTANALTVYFTRSGTATFGAAGHIGCNTCRSGPRGHHGHSGR
jgi:hypothetical protein